jgi:hypothetical protein
MEEQGGGTVFLQQQIEGRPVQRLALLADEWNVRS